MNSRGNEASATQLRPDQAGPKPGSASPPQRSRSLTGDEPVLGGVARSVAAWLDVEPIVTRVSFVVLAVAGGVGIVLYGALWVTFSGRPSPTWPPDSRRDDPLRSVGVVLVVLGLLLLLRRLSIGFADAVVWPVALVGFGLAFVWDQLDSQGGWRWVTGEGRDEPVVELGGFSTRAHVLRLAGGIVLVLGGLGFFLAANLDLDVVRDGFVAGAVLVGGLTLIFGPWLYKLSRSLIDERRQRIRSEEKAEMAAHLHDSVLQTLTIIQKRTEDPEEIVALARRQERELRQWLYGEDRSRLDRSFADAIEVAAAEVEDLHRVHVEVVTVGDAEVDEVLEAAVGAAREALTNAAKFSGESRLSLYAEVNPDRAEIYVRDRGRGFEPNVVPGDRRGIADSIMGRMERVGGSADVRSADGEGCEVAIRVARTNP